MEVIVHLNTTTTGLTCTNMYRSMHPSPLSRSRNDRNHDEESDSGTSDNGLGITFYDHRGVARRNVSSPLQLQGGSRGSEAVGVLSHVQRTRRLAPLAKQLQIESPASDDSVPTPRPATACPTDLTRSPSALLEELLEENLRGQAETFVRIASRSTPVRVLSSTLQSGSRSASAPVALRGLGISTGGTPSRTSAASMRVPAESSSPSPLTSQTPSNNDNNNHNITSRSIGSPSIPHPVDPRPRPQKASELCQTQRKRSGFSPRPTEIALGSPTPFFQLNHLRIPWSTKPVTSPSRRQQRSISRRGPGHFTSEERRAIEQLVHANPRGCERHDNCTDCRDIEYAYHENKALPLTMDPEQRQKIINNNRSLRNIKNELESLAEHGAITDEVYDTIMSALPAESPLGGSTRNNPVATTPVAPTPAVPNPAATPSPAPVAALSNLQLNRDTPPSDAPPAYRTPALPAHSPAPPPMKAEIARATAQYRYSEPGDCNFEPGDQISILEYMNQDWWLGKNLRTGLEGVFPATYVTLVPMQNMYMNPHGVYGNEKGYAGYPAQHAPPPPPQQMQPPAPGPSNPYNSSVPPMAIAEQPTDDKSSKGSEMGKKFGKKLGNAAIFGAGATIGGNLVNSIF
ncbi:hypothetical protein JHW43_000349 [Diplocarpon mali]|nr:hypothetical protein JHW43_000349 [Diplocarpon mali]